MNHVRYAASAMISKSIFVDALLWIGLFGSTAVTDWLSARWADTTSRIRRAHLSAVHEAVGFIAGFTIYLWTQSIWTIIPCVLGAWFGSYFAGIDREELDPAFVQAVHDAVELVIDRESRNP